MQTLTEIKRISRPSLHNPWMDYSSIVRISKRVRPLTAEEAADPAKTETRYFLRAARKSETQEHVLPDKEITEIEFLKAMLDEVKFDVIKETDE